LVLGDHCPNYNGRGGAQRKKVGGFWCAWGGRPVGFFLLGGWLSNQKSKNATNDQLSRGGGGRKVVNRGKKANRGQSKTKKGEPFGGKKGKKQKPRKGGKKRGAGMFFGKEKWV